MLYIVQKTYIPNTAPANRLMAYARGLSELGVEATFVSFTPDEKFSRHDAQLPHIYFKHYWERWYFKGRNSKYISFFLYAVMFAFGLKKEDKVLFYGAADYMHLILRLRKNINYYVEKTEYPGTSMLKTRFGENSLDDYLKECRRANGVFVISTALKEYFIEKGVDKNKVHIINMIVDPARFEGLRKEPSERYIAYCGAADNSKDGVDCLLRAFSIVANTQPDVKLYIIGPVPNNKDASANINLAKELRISERVVFTGTVPSEIIPQMLKNAEILALARPSNIQAKYGFPTKLGEYLLTENPVVLTDVGDVSLFLEDGVSAFIAKPNDERDFANKILNVLSHRDDSLAAGKQGSVVARNSFDCIIETKKLYSIINKN